MRIAVLTHGLHRGNEAADEYAIGLLAELWRADGHEVRFLVGHREVWPADIALLHVDSTVVPHAYLKAARRYPYVVNGRIVDISKRKVSSPAVWPEPGYSGPAFVKSDLNSAGIPERRLGSRRRLPRLWRRLARRPGETAMDFSKHYLIYEDQASIPSEVARKRHAIVQKFVPEIEDGRYFIRRCFVFGARIICYRKGNSDPIVDVHEDGLFSWIDVPPAVVAWQRTVALDYGTIDYVIHKGDVVVLDVNKTPGRSRTRDEAGKRDYERIIRHVAPGLYDTLGPRGESEDRIEQAATISA